MILLPDLVAKVLSTATESVDFIKKMAIYMNTGINEYWIVSRKTAPSKYFY